MKNIEINPLAMFLFVIFVVLSFCFSLNTLIDASGINTYSIVYKLTIAQTRNHVIVWDKPFDQRAWVRAKLLEKGECPFLLILGSSTLGGISQDMFNNVSILNAWLTGPAIEDFYGISEILAKANCIPKNILFGIDPWYLNKNVISQRWMSIYSDYLDYHNRGNWLALAFYKGQRIWAVFKERLSYPATQESLKTLADINYKRYLAPKLYNLTAEEFCESKYIEEYQTSSSEVTIRANDGHFKICQKFALAPKQLHDVALGYLRKNMHKMAEWHELDGMRLTQIEKILKEWAEKGSKILIVSPAYHPLTYDILMRNSNVRHNLETLDEFLNGLSGYHIKYLYLRNPDILGCKEYMFSDSHHAAPSCFEKMAYKVEQTISETW
jgi:hypothetical protein